MTGEYAGWGTVRFADGEVYEGEWRQRAGDVLVCRRQHVPDVHVGFRAGERERRGTVQIANGGPAAGWEVVGVILLDEADRIAQALGQSVDLSVHGTADVIL